MYTHAIGNMAESTPIEAVLAGNKPPWRPKVSGYVALFCGPIAGALVAAASFRSMGLPRKAQQTMSYTLLLCIAFLIPLILGIPAGAPIKKLIAVAVEGAGIVCFPPSFEKTTWRGDALTPTLRHATITPRLDGAFLGCSCTLR